MNVSSVKNLNGETFSAVQDATLTDVVQSNSAQWGQGGNPEVENYVVTNSATIDETVTSFQTNSSTYMVEPNLEFNAVNEISGYNGSAIAQYGAEKQWLVHDGTLVHLSNSAQYALGVNLSAVAQLLGVDETVLYSGAGTTAASLSEPITNFNKIEIYCYANEGYSNNDVHILTCPTTNTVYDLHYGNFYNDTNVKELYYSRYVISGNNFVKTSAHNLYTENTTWYAGYVETFITKIIGIGRKS